MEIPVPAEARLQTTRLDPAEDRVSSDILGFASCPRLQAARNTTRSFRPTLTMADIDADPPLDEVLYMLNHVFLPPKLPQADDSKAEHDIALCDLTYRAAIEFRDVLPEEQQQAWSSVIDMLERLLSTTIKLDRSALEQDILDLDEGGVLALRIRAQNAALIVRRLENSMVFESFEVQPLPEAVMQTEGKLVCSFPGPAVELPLEVAQDSSFVENLASFLVQMDADNLPGAQPITLKARSTVVETRSTAHPRYITQLLSMILLGMGKEAEVKRITKRIADDVCWNDAHDPWRRSALWLVIRVAVQTSSASPDIYKLFMIFLQMKLLRLFLKYDLSSELLYLTRIKTSRRVYKLGEVASPILESMKILSDDIEACLQARWKAEQQRQAWSPIFIPEPEKFHEHTTLSLTNSRSYLAKVMQPVVDTHSVEEEFRPSSSPRLRDIENFHDLSSGVLSTFAALDPYLALADFEWLVEEHLDDWTVNNISSELAAETLSSCLEQYLAASQIHYAPNPEDESIMLLTTLALWMALDKISVAQCPLLSSYSPLIPVSFLDPLLLRRERSIQHAAIIQRYLDHRHSVATSKISIYANHLEETSFSVQYFRQSLELQRIKASIEQSAMADREMKLAQLQAMNTEHANLMSEIDSLECSDSIAEIHKQNCQKCQLKKRVNSMRITVHEWPLPSCQLDAEAVVFELNCPLVFLLWRKWTYCILRDIGMAHVQVQIGFTPHQILGNYDPLRMWASTQQEGRIVFASGTKSFLGCHYRDVKIPAAVNSVCVNNGLCFRLYDCVKGEFVRSIFKANLESFCTLRLPQEGPYQNLQYAVTYTTHSPNMTITNQIDCPTNLNLHEYLAFTNLRCGLRLQWMNIARELCSNALTFSHEEVHVLLMQTAWQIGPLNDDKFTRKCHYELANPDFGRVFIRECIRFLSHVEANWTEGTAVKSIIYLTSRLLSSAKDKTVLEESYFILRKARQVVYRWMCEIVDRLQDAVDNDQINLLGLQACEMGILCRATFDVDSIHLDQLLCSEDDVAILIESTIVVNDNLPTTSNDKLSGLQRLLTRDRRLSYALEPYIKRHIEGKIFSRGMNSAIQRIWPGYRSGSGWRLLSDHSSQWLTSLTASVGSQRTQQLHYNILDGTFLVDGQRLGRLPPDIVGHPTYRRIFGQKVLRVLPADIFDMEYVSRSAIYCHQVFFALRSGELIIRAKSPSGRDLELIPHVILQGDLPRLFSMEYAHWMDIVSGVLDFRPLDSLWTESGQNMRLIFSASGSSRLELDGSGNSLLFDIRSATFLGIAARFHPLELPEYLTVRHDLDKQTSKILIDLPRFRLSFQLKNGEIESNNLEGMIVDHKQCTGTMIGLQNQLVLCHKDRVLASLPRSRCVLIPFGQVDSTFSTEKNHVCVKITNFKRFITWYKYDLDEDLGILVGSAGLTSRLYRIYLHALCSHPLPDSLTKQRGVDHAVQELTAATSFSFQAIADVDLKLLQLLRRLTPRRRYYPQHLRCMQITEWSSQLPSISQHGAFEEAVTNILQHAISLSIFSDNKVKPETSHDQQTFLTARASRRSIAYSDKFSTSADAIYQSRDSPHPENYDCYGLEALKTSRLIYSWPAGLTCRLEQSELLHIFEVWSQVNGPTRQISLEYSREWLELDLSQSFLDIYDLCRRGLFPKFALIFSFCALAYNISNPQSYIPILLTFATVADPTFPPPPSHVHYNLADGYKPQRKIVQHIIALGRFPLMYTPSGTLFQLRNETVQDFILRRQKHYEEATWRIASRAVHSLFKRPYLGSALMSLFRGSCASPFDEKEDSHWFNVDEIMAQIEVYITSCANNNDLRLFISQLTVKLQSYPGPKTILQKEFEEIPRFCFGQKARLRRDRWHHLSQVVKNRKAPIPLFPVQFPADHTNQSPVCNNTLKAENVETLINQFQKTCGPGLSNTYRGRLEESKSQLESERVITALPDLPPVSICLAYRDQCQRQLETFLCSLCSALGPSSTSEKILAQAGLWPPDHPRRLLSCLASTSKMRLSKEWLDALINLAFLFMSYQYSQRLVSYAHRQEVDNFFQELQHSPFNWSDAAVRYPDWLLIQIEGNFAARPVQSNIAHEMIWPASGSNTILQLNMGEGKSHVIVPLVAVALADSTKLVRVIVSKPLSGQMFHLLVERISGLTNRRVFYLPFSREVKMNSEQIQSIQRQFEDCTRAQGVLVAQPEHILSFRLMVINQILTSALPLQPTAQHLQQIQGWLTSTTRDILDESDELLHVRYQLIYTMGEQQPFDGSPDRWKIIQEVFDLVRCHMQQLDSFESWHQEVEFLHATKFEGEFPLIRLLGSRAAKELVSRIAEDAVSGRLEALTLAGVGSSSDLRHAVLSFMKERSISSETYQIMEHTYGQSGQWKILLLLRGLLSYGILTYVLSQLRWRVDYGLDPSRSLLAVPYRAKDMPSLRSEFGHPDVAICLTCLTYYYGGLTFAQVQECFDLLAKVNNAPLEYESWVRRGGRDIPESLRELKGVNTQDVKSFKTEVAPKFQHNQATIAFYLGSVVFPKEAKEFPSKLGTSGWDLVEEKGNISTGFSGTNDNSDLLPTSITPADTVNQLATNARVLDYLLRSENERYICTRNDSGRPSSVAEFLDLISSESQEIRVLLDVGAQMLEMTNKQLITHWLSLTTDEVAAGVFFDDTDHLAVISKDGVVEGLYASPYYQRLHECIIYLDDAHTRGTDLKLPRDYRAAVTLGPRVTKDRLVQGCMRMRKLGNGQSVVFCAPPEIDRRIRHTQKLKETDEVKIVDVLSWVMSTTCEEIENYIPHWIQQGVDYHARQSVDFTTVSSEGDVERLESVWLQPAAQTLEEMYGPSNAQSGYLDKAELIPEMYDRLQGLGVVVIHEERVDEEQEREVQHELEQEKDVEPPPKIQPARHRLDREIRSWVRDGVIPTTPGILSPLMAPLKSSGLLESRNSWWNGLICSQDFMTTTQSGREKSEVTSYLRPVQWILSHTRSDGSTMLVVLSPYEVNLLLPDIRASKHVRLHMYAPRTTRAMKPFDDLEFYCIPPLSEETPAWTPPNLDVRCQLNIWGGQLYLEKYETYLRMCLLLGISSSEDEEYTTVENDRFVPPSGRVGEMVEACLFDKSPVVVLKTLFGLRRKGMSFDMTHMGKILNARLLRPEDFDEVPAV